MNKKEQLKALEEIIDFGNQKCNNCKYWNRSILPPGKMPGVRKNYRACGVARMHSSSRIEWRAPTDWCSQWEKGKKPIEFKSVRGKPIPPSSQSKP